MNGAFEASHAATRGSSRSEGGHGAGVGASGSRNIRLSWTGPAGARVAAASAYDASASHGASDASAAEGGGMSLNQRSGWRRPTCGTVWLAPVSRSSGGRSAVRRRRGTRSVAASTTAGSRLATAVPEVTITAAQHRVARA